MKLPLISYVNLFSDLLPVGTGLYRWKDVKRNHEGAMLVFSFVVLAATTELITYFMAMMSIRNLWVAHFYNVGEFVLLMSLFARWQEESPGGKTIFILKPSIMKLSIVAFLAFWLISKWTFERWDEQAGYTYPVATLVFILLSLFTLYRLVQSSERKGEKSFFKNFKFWVVAGILTNFAGGAVFFLLMPVLSTLSKDTAIAIWSIHWGVNTLVNMLYACGFLCLNHRQTA